MAKIQKLERVLTGLRICMKGLTTCPEECPYYRQCEGQNKKPLMGEIYARLKAYEPRVMTLEEYDAWTDIPFTERDPVFHEERTERGTVTCWVNTTVCSLREYGQNDRCWTARPTNEQMKATPWIKN